MRQFLLFTLIFIVSINVFAQNGNTITISGQVTDFDGNPIDSCEVDIMNRNFNLVDSTITDNAGHYILKDIEKGDYMALAALRMKDYVYSNAVPEKDMRLEFWAWNIIADKDLTINPRYHRLELYGFQVFDVMGGPPYMWAYVRPMSLGKALSYGKDVYLDKQKSEKMSDINVQPEDIDFKIYLGDETLTIHSVQPVEEYCGDESKSMRGFFLQFDYPKNFSGNYCIFRIEATHKLFGGEKGESVYFYEIKDYK